MQSTIDPCIMTIDANNDTTIAASEVQIEQAKRKEGPN